MMAGRGGLEKRSCKPVEQEENHEKGPTRVVDKKPNGKSQVTLILITATKKKLDTRPMLHLLSLKSLVITNLIQ
jgi:hypothetical protein